MVRCPLWASYDAYGLNSYFSSMSYAQDLNDCASSVLFPDLMSSYLDGAVVFEKLNPFLRVDGVKPSDGALGVPSVAFCMQVSVSILCVTLFRRLMPSFL